MKTPLEELRDLGVKMSHARHALTSFQEYKSIGKFPPVIAARSAPTLQCSKEFSNSPASAGLATLASNVNEHNKNLLDCFIALKESEVRFLSSTYLDSKVFVPALQKKLGQARNLLLSLHPNNPPSFINDEYKEVEKSLPAYGHRAIQIGTFSHQAELRNREKKKQSKVTTDLKMTDPDTKVLINELRTELLSKLGDRKRKARGGGKSLPNLHDNSSLTVYSSKQPAKKRPRASATRSRGPKPQNGKNGAKNPSRKR